MKFRMPTPAELLEEWRTEYDVQDLFDGGGSSLLSKTAYDHDIQRETFLDLFTKDISEIGNVVVIETFKPQDKGINGWYGETIEDICNTTNHMLKDPKRLMEAFLSENGELPYILVMKTIHGKYEILGGRTRCGVAHLLDMPVTALVFDQKGVGDLLLSVIKDKMSQRELPCYIGYGVDTTEMMYRVENHIAFLGEDLFSRKTMLFESLSRFMKKYGMLHTRSYHGANN